MEALGLYPSVSASTRPTGQAARDGTGPEVCLVTALTVSDFVDPELTESALDSSPQIGVLTLAASLRERGYRPHVVNLDDLFLEYLRVQSPPPPAGAVEAPPGDDGPDRSFFRYVADRLEALTLDVIGFSSICSSYPLTLRLVGEVKRLRPDACVLLGGPQASVVDVATLREFPGVDFVVRGEADQTLPAFLDALHGSDGDGDSRWGGMPGITFRRGGEVVRNPNAPPVEDLDLLPLPAFDLDAHMDRRNGVHLEIGRGCPYACTFCSTNDFFRRNFRLKSPATMIRDMDRVKEAYGITYFSLVHDMYTIDRKRVIAFCDALIARGAGYTWGCSARTDCIDDALIALMAKAGCRGIFFGIETGSDRLQHVINKKLDLAEAWERIRCADRHGIDTAVALITGFPEETREDLRDTIHFYIDSLRYDHAEPQISLLAPLAATPIYEQHKDRLEFDAIFSDMSHQGWRHDPTEVEMIRQHPDVFPNFYAIPTTWVSRAYLKEIIDFVTYLAAWYRWLPVALLHDRGDFLDVFDRWRQWLAEKRGAGPGEETGLAPYYSHRKFRTEFAEFARDCYVEEMATDRAAIAAVVKAEGVSLADRRRAAPREGGTVQHAEAGHFPYVMRNVIVLELGIDYKEIVECLREGRPLSLATERDVSIAFLPRENRIQVWQLASECADLVRLCDGERTVAEITREYGVTHTDAGEIPSETVGRFGLMLLQEQGVIGFASSPVTAVEADPNGGSGCCTNGRSPSPPQAAATQQPWPPRDAVNRESEAVLNSATV